MLNMTARIEFPVEVNLIFRPIRAPNDKCCRETATILMILKTAIAYCCPIKWVRENRFQSPRPKTKALFLSNC